MGRKSSKLFVGMDVQTLLERLAAFGTGFRRKAHLRFDATIGVSA